MRCPLVRAVVRRLRGGDEGVSLAELLVTMLLMGVLGGLVATSMLDTHRVVRNTDDEARGLADVRLVSERLARDIRGARGVDAAANSTQLTLWIDYDADYKQSDPETITWRVEAVGDGHFRVLRSVKNGATAVQATSLVVNMAFAYDSVVTTETRLVTVRMEYDVLIGYRHGTDKREVNFQTRLRNVE